MTTSFTNTKILSANSPGKHIALFWAKLADLNKNTFVGFLFLHVYFLLLQIFILCNYVNISLNTSYIIFYTAEPIQSKSWTHLAVVLHNHKNAA